MRKLLAIVCALFIAGPAWANFDVTTGSGTHIFAIDAGNQGTSLCAAASTECPASVPVNTAGSPLFTNGNAGFVQFPSAQAISGTVTANLGTLNVAATTACVAAINTTLGSPFQAGGSIGNTGFNALQGGSANAVGNPFFVSPGTGASFTVTCAACATSANQTTANTSLATIAANTGAAVPAGTNLIGNVGALPPAGSTSTNGSNTGTTAATSTTLAADAAKTEYVCWISIRANATAAATGNATLSDGTKTFNFTQWTAPTASGLGVTEEVFNPCIPATAVNTAWTLTSAAPGTGGVVSVSIGGFKL